MRRTVVLALLAVFTLGDAAPAWALPIEPVSGLAEPDVNEAAIVASEDYYAYVRVKPTRSVARIRSRTTADDVAINDSGSAWVEGFDPGTDHVLITLRSVGGDTGLYLYDPVSQTLQPLPVNTAAPESSGKISTTYVLFTRAAPDGIYVELYDRDAESFLTVGHHAGSKFVVTDSVGDRYATWTVCSGPSCKVFVYDAMLDTKTVLPTTSRGLPQYLSALDEANDRVYFVRSGNPCGQNVRIRSVPLSDLDGTTSLVATLPAGKEVGTMSFFHEPTLDVDDLYFTRAGCRSGNLDAFAVRGVGGP
jgi:hypothetical protein